MNKQNVQPSMLKDEAYTSLERMIVNGDLAPGEWVSETDLIEASGYTRASVRSAVQRLEDQELIKIFPRRGAQVCPIDYTRQFRALELRRAVETLIARSAAKRASEEQKNKFLKLSKSFIEVSQSGNQLSMTEVDSENYALLLETADNPFAAKAMTSVKGLSRRFWVMYSEEYGDIEKMADAHSDIALAVSNADEDAAEKAVENLISYVEQFTLEVVGYGS
ncbi:GntR family transcriptional regulator [Amylibacter sp. SFDW26]|uniref:GntR family transcriptional regulator n=1 Tax=Amylibacter sp. SFDW26 TaxID=2652722 RepID=UPI001262A74B|nr:GntR family transcriptional regulator [Amylibacter sp. SFDW26]KAB7614403.1 GntR family transcriptional regulator [Amylibacter sp. SFDW26]